jgi:hypothetical protein
MGRKETMNSLKRIKRTIIKLLFFGVTPAKASLIQLNLTRTFRRRFLCEGVYKFLFS